jgi:hypothetical protein
MAGMAGRYISMAKGPIQLSRPRIRAILIMSVFTEYSYGDGDAKLAES